MLPLSFVYVSYKTSNKHARITYLACTDREVPGRSYLLGYLITDREVHLTILLLGKTDLRVEISKLFAFIL